MSASRLMALPTTRADLAKRIAPLLAQLDGPKTGDAVRSLTEIREALPLIAEEYEREANGGRRRWLIHCLWQYRDRAAIPILVSALADPDERVWKESLEGLVTLGGVDVLTALAEAVPASQGPTQAERRRWIEEAIEQVRSATPADR